MAAPGRRLAGTVSFRIRRADYQRAPRAAPRACLPRLAEHSHSNPLNPGLIDFSDVCVGDPRYDLLALHFGTFHANKGLLRACLEAYGWPHLSAEWPREMLALSLLHDFNMFDALVGLDRFRSLDDLADAIWNLDSPFLTRAPESTAVCGL